MLGHVTQLVGQRDGSTVVQVYLRDRTGRVSRPRRELAGFAKVRLAAGQSTEVSVVVPARAFAFYDVDSAGWLIPDGDFEVEVGLSSGDIAHIHPVRVTGGFKGKKGRDPLIAASDQRFARRLGRSIPTPRPVKPYSRVSTIGEVARTPVGLALRSAVLRLSGFHGETDPVTAKMVKRSVDEMPLRAIALLGEGRVRLGMIDGLVDVLNRRPGRAAGRIARGLRGLLPGG